jgi:hypothetical protein
MELIDIKTIRREYGRKWLCIWRAYRF